MSSFLTEGQPNLSEIPSGQLLKRDMIENASFPSEINESPSWSAQGLLLDASLLIILCKYSVPSAMMKNWMCQGCLIPFLGDECKGRESLVEWLHFYWDSGNGGRKRWAAIFWQFCTFFITYG